MPAIIRQLTPQSLEAATYEADSLAEAARFEPEGVYTIANTFETFKVLKLDAHLDRLEDSSRREDIPLRLDRPRLRRALRQMIAESGFGNVRYRITVPGRDPQTLILTIEPFAPYPAEMYTGGVRCVTVPEGKRHNPAAKTTDWMERREAIRAAFPAGVYEGLLLDDRGRILEGLSSNFYVILDGELRTAGEGVLAGISRQIVLEVAPAIIPVREEAIFVGDRLRMDEAFITSSSRGIVPVVEIDGSMIGDGAPGPFTRALREAYQAWVEANLDEL